jgi:microcystin-dependent protein
MSGNFIYNNATVESPPGSIMQYMGTTEPNGWIICDGVSRSNTDGKYNRLITLNIGTAGVGPNTTYSPPNLVNMFLLGKPSGTNIGTFGGNQSITLSPTNLPSHSHEMRHTHYAAIQASNPVYGYVITGWSLRTGLQYKIASSGNYAANGVSTTDTYVHTDPGNNTAPNTSAVGSGSAIPTIPPYKKVFHILKY